MANAVFERDFPLSSFSLKRVLERVRVRLQPGGKFERGRANLQQLGHLAAAG